MLELRPICEQCAIPLPPHSSNAMICSFECTYCAACAKDIFHHICPNCKGNLVPRPIRPSQKLVKYPATTKKVFKPR